jgi:uncharacterized protein YndB with AHSA1/START domain
VSKKKVILGIVAVPVLLVAGVVITGFSIEPDHVAKRTVTLKAAPDVVYKAIADFEKHGEWRPDIKKIERLPDKDGHPQWKETNGFGVIALEQTEADAPKKLVTRITDPDLPFGGTWTYELAAEGGGTRVSITEKGTVKNPVFRFMSRFVFGYTATLDSFLKDLGKKGGEEVTPRDG